MRTALVLAVLLAGCAHAPARPAPNARCPIMTDLEPDGATYVTWRGERIGFCCAQCVDKWDRMSDADRERALARAR